MAKQLKPFVAACSAVVASILAVVAAMVVSAPAENWASPDAWYDGPSLAISVGSLVVACGLVPGLLLHALFVRLRWTTIWQYVMAAAVLAAAWSAFFLAQGANFAFEIASASVVGTITFWLVRRPDAFKT